MAAAAGRGSAWFLRVDDEQWVLRHYRRGGLIARWVADRYAWLGVARTRAFAEWHLLADLFGLALPVPRPVAARVERCGVWRYRADLIIARIPNAESLAERLRRAPLNPSEWQSLGEVIATFHAAGVHHHDLNAHNILLDDEGRFFLIDFDRGRRRRPGRWARRNLARLRRSLDKLAADGDGLNFAAGDWAALLRGYSARLDNAA